MVASISVCICYKVCMIVFSTPCFSCCLLSDGTVLFPGVNLPTPNSGVMFTGTGGRCPSGAECPQGSTYPAQCAPGTYAPSEGLTACLACPEGVWSVCISVCLFIPLLMCVYLSVCPPAVCPSTCLHACFSVHPSANSPSAGLQAC